MTKHLLTNELWAELAPLIPADPERPRGGRPLIPARDVLNGILFVLFTATAWELLPYDVAHCSGMTCWRRLRDWHALGIWQALHQSLLDKLNCAGEIDWPRASVDASPVPAKKGAMRQARTPRIEANPAVNAIS